RGYAEVLQWALDAAGENLKRKSNSGYCFCAENVQVLKVLREHGCAWSEQTCTSFASLGELEVLQWAVRNGCPWDEQTTREAARKSRLSVMKWAIENSCPM